MKEVYNISLQGVSFAVEKDACEMLESYLQELKLHYGKQEEEVVNDIEERIAELLVEKGCTGGTVVQTGHVEDIIKVLGRPSEIDGDSGSPDVCKVKKSIYRDTQNGIVAGVCSGLGAYFNMDAVWVRIIFILAALLFTAPTLFIHRFLGINMSWLGFMLLTYLILWIIIPEAKTVSQRCAMRGESQRVDHIHKKFAQGARNVGNEMWQMGSQATGSFFSTLWRIVRFTAGVVLASAGFGGMVMLGIGFLGVDMITGFSVMDIPDYMELNVGSTLLLKILCILTLLLPCVGMLYAGIQLCFNFKSPKWRPGLINFLVWLVCALMFVIYAFIAFNPYYNVNDHKKQLALETKSDTLYVVCPKPAGMERAKMGIDASHSRLELFYLNNTDRKNTSFALYPDVVVRKKKDVTAPYIEAEMVTFSKPTLYDALEEDVKISDIITVQDSLLAIKPAVYSRENKFSGKLQTIRIYVPDSTEVILKDPIDFTFGKSRSYRSGIRK